MAKTKPATTRNAPSGNAIVDSAASIKKLQLSLGLIIAAFAFILYAQSIAFDYALDDATVLQGNRITTQGFGGIPKLLVSDRLLGCPEVSRTMEYRPLPMVLFAMEWQFFKDNSMVYHLMNVALYAITCFLLFILLCKIFENGNLVFPFVCSVLYAAHPIHTEVVDNIKSSDEILCFLFGIISILFLLKYLKDNSNFALSFSLLTYFFSLMSKETGIVFFIIIPMTVYFFSIQTTKKIARLSSWMLLVSLVYLIIRMQVLKSVPIINNVASDSIVNAVSIDNSLIGITDFVSRQATAFYILFKYILLLIFPHPLCYDYSFNQIKTQTLGNLPALTGIIVYAALFFFSFIMIKKKNILAFAILFYLISLAPVSNIIILIGITMAERFMYIPSLGFCIIMAYFIIRYAKADSIKNKYNDLSQFFSTNATMFMLLLVILGLYSFKTISRNGNWKNDKELFMHDVEVADNSVKAHYYLGIELSENLYLSTSDSNLKKTYIDRAIIEFKKSLDILPLNDLYRKLGRCYDLKMDYKNSILVYNAKIKMDKFSDSIDFNNLSKAYYNLGHQYSQTKQYDKAIPIYDSALKYKPNFSEAYNNKSVALLNTKNYDEAIAVSDMAIKLDEKNAKAYVNKGCAYSNLKQFDKALEYFNKAIVINPNEHDAYYFMGVTYFNMGDKERAKTYFDKAEQIKR